MNNTIIAPASGTYPDNAYVVVREEGDYYAAFRMGGGFEVWIPKAETRTPTIAEVTTTELRYSKFCFDDGDGDRARADSWNGWHDGTHWNGWAKPYFVREIMEQVLDYLCNAPADHWRIEDDKIFITFGSTSNNEEEDEFGGRRADSNLWSVSGFCFMELMEDDQ